MYIFKNAWRNITRCKGRNLLIGAILTTIILCITIALSIHEAGEHLVESYKDQNALRISIQANRMGRGQPEQETIKELTLEQIKTFGDSDLIKDFYYVKEIAASSSNINPVSEEINQEEKQGPGKEKMGNMGDFRITAYSNFSYLEDFVQGKKKIVEGSMISGNKEEKEIVISQALKEENQLEIGSEITFYLPEEEEKTITFQVVGIYETVEEEATSNFLKMNALNEDNQIYANISSLEELEENTSRGNNLTAYFYLNKNDDLEAFQKEVTNKGLSNDYIFQTNEEEILETLRPVQNIASFSFHFLIVVLVVGGCILAILNFLLIRERKYEIGVLRAIGMSKKMITWELIIETLIIACFSLILGTGTGFVLSQPITNQLLKNEIASYETKQEKLEESFGSAGFQKPSEQIRGGEIQRGNRMKIENNINFVDHLKVTLSPTTLLLLVGVTLLLSIISVASASIFINQYNPNKILQNR